MFLYFQVSVYSFSPWIQVKAMSEATCFPICPRCGEHASELHILRGRCKWRVPSDAASSTPQTPLPLQRDTRSRSPPKVIRSFAREDKPDTKTDAEDILVNPVQEVIDIDLVPEKGEQIPEATCSSCAQPCFWRQTATGVLRVFLQGAHF
jgi:hypothetical protein